MHQAQIRKARSAYFTAVQDLNHELFLSDDAEAVRGKRAEIKTICVTEKARNHGSGARVAEAVFAGSKTEGADYVMVETYARMSMRAVFTRHKNSNHTIRSYAAN